jgi:hypothetical protein
VVHNDNTGADLEANGPGLRLTVTADVDADGSDAYTQTVTGVKENTTYLVTARVMAEDVPDSECHLTVTTAGSVTLANLPDTNATDSVFETLTGTFTTDASGTAVVIQLQNDADTASSVCEWDSVGVYELGTKPAAVSKGFLWTGTSTATTSWATDAGDTQLTALDSPIFEVPADNCYAKAEYSWGWTFTDHNNTNIMAWAFVLQYKAAGGSWTQLVGNSRGYGGDVANTGSTDPDAGDFLCANAYIAMNTSTNDRHDFRDARSTLTGRIGNLTAGDSFQVRLLADQITSDTDGSFALDASTGPSDATSSPHHMWVEMVCH